MLFPVPSDLRFWYHIVFWRLHLLVTSHAVDVLVSNFETRAGVFPQRYLLSPDYRTHYLQKGHLKHMSLTCPINIPSLWFSSRSHHVILIIDQFVEKTRR